MKARYLPEVLRFFDPRRRLQGQELQDWFVPRAGMTRQLLRAALLNQPERQKFLFVGHRGSGKTTELTKLADEIKDQFYAIAFDILDITGRASITYEDLMLTISTQVMLDSVRRKLIGRPLLDPMRERWEELRMWWERVVAGPVSINTGSDVELGVGLETLLGKISVGVKQSSTARDAILREIGLRMPELIDHLNWVVEQAETGTQQRLLIIVEGLDKIDLESARSVFRDHTATLVAPSVTIIYSFPIALRHSDDYRNIVLNFHENVYYFPNIAPTHADGTPDQKGLDTLRSLVLKRIDPSVLATETLDYLLHANGGVPIWLVRLVHKAALYALARDEQAIHINLEDAKNAVKDLRREIVAPLTSHEVAVLSARHRDRRLANDDDERRLLYKGALIDYSNGETWCDVHPALIPLLERDNGNTGP